jgi:hypothetical protein
VIDQLSLAQAIPINDWQFWVVTIIALAAITLAARNLIPGLRKKKSTRVDLTINRDHDAPSN